MKNISQYEYIKNNDDILILINDSSDDDIQYLYLFKVNNLEDVKLYYNYKI